MNNHHKSILKLLLYYDIFDHVLSLEEIKVNCCMQELAKTLPHDLDELASNGLIYQINGYYSLRNDVQLIEKRKEGSQRAQKIMPKALRMARLITAFPYIRSVSFSGSLSKDYMYEKGDVDFFIIAQPERLWLARTLLILYKRIFLLNSYKYFCLNYFVDEKHMEINQKNMFTATELFTLLPITGRRYIRKLMEANSWVNGFYQQFPMRDVGQVDSEKNRPLKRTLEWLMNNKTGDWLDRLAMKTTVKYWSRKYKDSPNDPFNRSFKMKRHIAKYHPENFQDLVLERYEQKLSEFVKEKQIELR
jgi:hypothetical protein